MPALLASPIAGAFAGQVTRAGAKWLAGWAGGHALDAMLEPGFTWLAEAGDPPIEQLTTPQIVNRINIVVNPGQADGAQAIVAMNELAQREGGPAELAAQAQFKKYAFDAASNAGLATLDAFGNQVLKDNGVPGAAPVGELNDAARQGIRNATRKPVDRLYCSKEFHEYEYCRKPKVRFAGRNWFEEVAFRASIGLSHTGTYGTFVDCFQMREAISYVRRVRNVTNGDGATRFANIFNETPEFFYNLVIPTPEFQEKVDAGVNAWNDLDPA